MNEFSDFFLQAYWWLSLLGGLHCLLLAFYIRHIYRRAFDSRHLLANIFNLIALYFFTGMLTRENSPIPLHLLMTLFIPVYFLLMPSLYLYCRRLLGLNKQASGLSWHFLPALVAMLSVTVALLTHIDLTSKAAFISISSLGNLGHFNVLGAVLVGLLTLQTGLYALAIIFMLVDYKSSQARRHKDEFKEIKFRWLLVLTLGVLVNWLIRALLVILPFYFGDQLSTLSLAVTRLSMLLTVYILVLYGLKQITQVAYLRGLMSASKEGHSKELAQVLSREEFNYLQTVLEEADTDNGAAPEDKE
ncbi:hypothetical protein [Shewanella salipaludis]|uniref:Uncharacterized protein n=1 Tax=Shewanella salipaludis TaxID=2723052 RepID=A0A972G620_9GAMM|nr:hypothetical protein [Shewanella salipaludis]NMH65115.1 hypothetical protein [Shewanella salipaludis]